MMPIVSPVVVAGQEGEAIHDPFTQNSWIVHITREQPYVERSCNQ
jgi:hypothetical protein